MEILVTRGVVVDAATIEEALEKTKPVEGVTVTLNAIPRVSTTIPSGVMTPAMQVRAERQAK